MPKDKCKVGISCGLSCIARNHKCLQGLPPEVQGYLESLSRKLSKVVKPGDSFMELLEGKGEEDQIFFAEMRILVSGKPRGKSEKFTYSDTEALGLNNRSEELIGAWRKGLREPGGISDYVSKYRNRSVSNEDVELFWESLPKGLQKNLSKMGDTKGQYWKGKDLDDDSVPTEHGGATIIRGKKLLKIYLQQGGRDLYTGERLPLTEADLEHIIPLSVGGKASEDPANWGFIRTGINSGRSERDLEEYITNTLKSNLGISPGGAPTEGILAERRLEWKRVQEDNELSRAQKKAANETDWSSEDDEVFDATLAQFRARKTDYNMVKAIVGKEGVSTTLGLPGTPAQIKTGRRGRDYWLTVGTYRSDQLPEGETLASWTSKKWKGSDSVNRAKIELFWRESQLEAQKAWRESDVLSDPDSARSRAKEISAELIIRKTEQLIRDLQ